MSENSKIPKIDFKLHPSYLFAYKSLSLFTRIKALGIFGSKFFYMVLRSGFYKIRFWTLRQDTVNVSRKDNVQNLRTNGYQSVGIDCDVRKELESVLSPYVSQLTTRLKKTSPNHRTFEDCQMGITDRSVISFLKETLNDAGVLDISSIYMQKKMRFKSFVLQINDETDTHHIHLGRVDMPLNYMHIDTIRPLIKCMIFLNRVDNDNGPLSCVPGTHLNKIGFLEYMIRVTNDRSGLGSSDDGSKKLFASLPCWLQKKANFGVDVLPSHPDVELIKNKELIISGPDDNIVLFDPMLWHRGGIVQKGRRVIMQVGLV